MKLLFNQRFPITIPHFCRRVPDPLDRMSFAPDHEKNRLEKQEVARALKAARQLELQANVDLALVSFFLCFFFCR